MSTDKLCGKTVFDLEYYSIQTAKIKLREAEADLEAANIRLAVERLRMEAYKRDPD